MVDIETTGNNSDRNAIIQISAVKFDYKSGQVSSDFFDRCLHIHPGRVWCPETRAWWTRQGNVLNDIQSRAEDPYTVVRAYYDWVLADWPTDRKEGRQLWAKPIHYEHPYLTNYLNMFGLDQPCHFRYAMDVNSFIRGLHGSPDHITYEEELPFEGEAHNAIFDVLHQIKVVLHAKNVTLQGQVLTGA